MFRYCCLKKKQGKDVPKFLAAIATVGPNICFIPSFSPLPPLSMRLAQLAQGLFATIRMTGSNIDEYVQGSMDGVTIHGKCAPSMEGRTALQAKSKQEY